jgi:hypothetical protein
MTNTTAPLPRARFHQETLELLTLIAYAYGEISIGRAVELLGYSREKIRDLAAMKIGTDEQILIRVQTNFAHRESQPSAGDVPASSNSTPAAGDSGTPTIGE